MQNFTKTVLESSVLNALHFSWIDYVLFVLMFGVSAAIGIYFGFFNNKQDTAEEYLLGGRSMNIFPIAMSLIASHLSGITLLGVPAEIYYFGIQYWACVVSATLSSIFIIYVYLPVFYELKISSSYEYLKVRFDGKIRIIASLLYVISTCLHVPIVIYIPALALNQVTGLNIHYVAPAVCAVCIFYTTIGGIKAVVWTDTLQFMVTVGSMAAVLFLGIYTAGGFANIWEKAAESGRASFNMDIDPTVRATFWGVSIGMGITWISNLGVNPSSVQRFLAVPSIQAARRSVVIFGLGVIITKSISCFSGLIMYAKYYDCDPLKAGLIKRKDQLLPYYVIDVAGNILGLPGLFISGVFSTALSTLSANLNTLAGTIYEDFFEPHISKETSEKRAGTIMKLMVVVIGCFCLALVLVIERLGGVLDISLSFHGMTAGPLLGLFTLGMLFRSANSKGALFGSIASFVCMSCIVFGQQMTLVGKKVHHPMKPTSIDGCDIFSNATFLNTSTTTTTTPSTPLEDLPLWIFRVSYYWYSLMGCSIVILVGLPVSWMTKRSNDEPVDPMLLSPAVRWLATKNMEPNKEYEMVSQDIDNNVGNHNIDIDKM